MLNLHTLKKSGKTEPEVGWLIAEEITHRLYEVLEILAGNTFGNLRQRLARHLLDIAASNPQPGSILVAHITQQELADAVGSVRPVVARLIKELKTEGLIEMGSSSGDGITLIRPVELLNETWSR